MTQRWKITAWIAGGLVVAVLGGWGVVANLDAADKVASVVSAFGTVAGLCMSGYGIVLARRGQDSGGQHVAGSAVAGGVVQVRGVGGDVRIGSAGASPPPAPPGPPPPSTPPLTSPSGGQRVDGSRVGGPVVQADGVGGDADLDR